VGSPEWVVGVDLGGTNLRAARVDAGGSVHERHRVPTDAGAGVDAVVSRIAGAVRHVSAGHEREIEGVGIGAPGLVDPVHGIVRVPPNLPGWREVPLAALVRKAVGYPTRIGNDANMVALAEWKCGAGRGARHLVCLTLGTGVGGGLVLDGRLYLGARGAAAEIGHMTVDPEGPQCRCGNRGCLERLIGAEGMVERARQVIDAGAGEGMLFKAGGDSAELTPEIIARAAGRGDEAARELLRESGEYLGIALASIVNLLDPEVIVIGGGISRAGELVLEPARATMRRRSMKLEGREIPIVPAALGDDAGVIGASFLARGEAREPSGSC
jgi:glucokinase